MTAPLINDTFKGLYYLLASMMEVTVTLLIAVVVGIVFYVVSSRKRGNEPPGPLGLPLVGYIPFLTWQPYLVLQKLAKQYGPVFSVQLGSQNVIVLSDFQSMKDAYSQDAFMGRPPTSPFFLSKETLETEAVNGLPWKEQRRFSLQMLRDLGFGKSRMEDMMKEELNYLLERLEQTRGEPTNIRPLMMTSTSNNIGSLVFGKRLKPEDPTRQMMDRTLNDVARAAGQVGWQLFFPWVTRLLTILHFSPQAKLEKIARFFKNYTEQEIENHEATLDENNIRDYIDGYLLEIRKRKNEPSFCKPVLADLVGAFFGAGSGTVRHTLDWLVLTMSAYTDVQQRVQEEIDDVIGRDRLPSWDDYPSMPYTQATITELMRWRTIVPLNLLRYTLADTELNGYFIPKHRYILSNIWAVHHDPAYWGRDAEIFRPERFLTDDGKQFQKSEYYIPFSIGKRACPGESFARIEVFLYFVTIMQKFQLRLPEGSVPDFDGVLGIGLDPKPYDVCLTKRP